jgi:hypothetical protein
MASGETTGLLLLLLAAFSASLHSPISRHIKQRSRRLTLRKPLFVPRIAALWRDRIGQRGRGRDLSRILYMLLGKLGKTKMSSVQFVSSQQQFVNRASNCSVKVYFLRRQNDLGNVFYVLFALENFPP